MAALPVQPELEVVRAEGAVLPEGQRWQGAVGAEALPPADHVVVPHCAQVAPPKPGAHTAWLHET